MTLYNISIIKVMRNKSDKQMMSLDETSNACIRKQNGNKEGIYI